MTCPSRKSAILDREYKLVLPHCSDLGLSLGLRSESSSLVSSLVSAVLQCVPIGQSVSLRSGGALCHSDTRTAPSVSVRIAQDIGSESSYSFLSLPQHAAEFPIPAPVLLVRLSPYSLGPSSDRSDSIRLHWLDLSCIGESPGSPHLLYLCPAAHPHTVFWWFVWLCGS
jgi:hypothetical protein